jgi:hypothetical protein
VVKLLHGMIRCRLDFFSKSLVRPATQTPSAAPRAERCVIDRTPCLRGVSQVHDGRQAVRVTRSGFQRKQDGNGRGFLRALLSVRSRSSILPSDRGMERPSFQLQSQMRAEWLITTVSCSQSSSASQAANIKLVDNYFKISQIIITNYSK